MSLQVVHARGSHRDLGRAQGEAFGDGIHRACGFYRRLAADRGGDFDVMGRRAHRHLEAARRDVPELVEELEGLAQGAGMSLDEALALNCLEEEWDVEACTTMVHGHLLMHAEQWYAGHSGIGVVIAEPHDATPFLSPTCVGFLPAVGMSAAGFAQGIDSLPATDERVGIPRILLSRLALGAPGLTTAVGAATTEGRAGGYAHVLASEHRTLVVETSATRHAVLEDVRAHTNHPLASELAAVSPPASAGSQARLSRAHTLLDSEPPSDLDDCTRVLSDHRSHPESICRHEPGLGGVETVFAMACDLAAGRMLVSNGRPCAGTWEELALPTSHALGRRVV